ncbi:lipoprotein [Kitasatospora indigofera]|uniref:Lipoprotein n=1 Tax=Kitasatospora indigofera TaxID=67307 RepID=A0A919FD45_9ACTN|nr:Ig-like domain-containing protein [Kitasatospora indigofera]GHH61528.1 lipoprotein [Kitasatospora indigofera]
MRPGLRVWARRAAAFGLCLLTGCAGSGAPGGGGGDPAPPPPSSRPVILVTPGDGSREVAPEGPVKVTVAPGGRLESVRFRDNKGAELPGTLAEDGASWRPDGLLPLGGTFSLDASAVDHDGARATRHTKFSTIAKARTFVAFFTPEDGSTVGVGMPVSLRFSRPIADRAAVERAVRVTAEPAVPVAAHWFGDQRLDFRPERYWAPGTKVGVALRFKGVQGAPGELGTQTKDVRFTVGRSQVSVVDLDAHTLTVRQGGKVVRQLKISGGAPEHSTYLGAMVVSEKFKVTRMNSQTVGLGDEYDIKDVPHAMRLTTSGTFVHGNYWADPEVFGNDNTSHGCIGLADAKGGGTGETPAGWLFEHTLTGDVIEVRGSAGEAVPPHNGLNGWNMPWDQWLTGSALRPGGPATPVPAASPSPASPSPAPASPASPPASPAAAGRRPSPGVPGTPGTSGTTGTAPASGVSSGSPALH